LAVAHSLAPAAPVDFSNNDDKDVKPLVKKERGGGNSGCYGGGATVAASAIRVVFIIN
jgi:hypothetical protein